MSNGIAAHFPITDLSEISDDITDGLISNTDELPLSHFDALRIDFSLARLKHYTGTEPEHVQPYILFTNYNRYVDEFVSWACEQIKDPDSRYIALSCVGHNYLTAENADPAEATSDLALKNFKCRHIILLLKMVPELL